MMIAAAITVNLILAQTVFAGVFFDSDFEAQTFTANGWSEPYYSHSGQPTLTTSQAKSGARSLQGVHQSLTTGIGEGIINTRFSSASDVWFRFYYRLSAGFQASAHWTKVIFLGTEADRTLGVTYYVLIGPGKEPLYTAQRPTYKPGDSENLYQNVGPPIRLNDEQWYCLEGRLRKDLVEMYIDGQLKISYAKPFAADGWTYDYSYIYVERGIGTAWWDRVAVGDSRIGCVDFSPPAPDAAAPAPPRSLVIQ